MGGFGAVASSGSRRETWRPCSVDRAGRCRSSWRGCGLARIVGATTLARTPAMTNSFGSGVLDVSLSILSVQAVFQHAWSLTRRIKIPQQKFEIAAQGAIVCRGSDSFRSMRFVRCTLNVVNRRPSCAALKSSFATDSPDRPLRPVAGTHEPTPRSSSTRRTGSGRRLPAAGATTSKDGTGGGRSSGCGWGPPSTSYLDSTRSWSHPARIGSRRRKPATCSATRRSCCGHLPAWAEASGLRLEVVVQSVDELRYLDMESKQPASNQFFLRTPLSHRNLEKIAFGHASQSSC